VGNISGPIRSEIKQLPFMIGKALGGIMAVIGFTVAVVIITRRAAPSFPDVLPSALFGCLGILVFVFSSRQLTRRIAENPAGNPVHDNRTRTSMLAWAILLLLAGIFLLITYQITR
jgi:hypothetical protein